MQYWSCSGPVIRARWALTRNPSALNFVDEPPRVCPVPIVGYIFTALVAYLLGSIPTGFLVAKARGIDIRTVGSGNIGATNVLRYLGKPAGIFVLVFDGLKGFAACAWFVDAVAKIFAALPGEEGYLRLIA